MHLFLKRTIFLITLLSFNYNFAQTKKDLRKIIKQEDSTRLGEFINKGFDINSDYSKGTSLLNRVILENKLELTKFLLKQESINYQRIQKDNFTTLHYLVSNGWYSLAKNIIERGVDPNTLGYKKSHILRSVLFNYQWGKDPKTSLEFIKHLYSKKINPQLSIDCCTQKTTLILLSCQWTEPTTVKFFIAKHPEKINDADHKGKTPLHYAVEKENVELVKLLLKNGAKSNIKDTKGLSAIDYSIKTKNNEIIELLKTNN